MAVGLDEKLSFATGCVINKDLVVIASEIDKIAQTKPHTQVLRYNKGEWSNFIVDWPIVSMCLIMQDGLNLLSLGPDGRIHIANKDGFSEEFIDQSENGPKFAGTLSQIKQIDGRVYAVGMARQVYRREGPGNWSAIDKSIRQPRDEDEIKGVLSIDGSGQDNLYAVGYGGEIYQFNGDKWLFLDIPTNVDLHYVKCIQPDLVYVAGQNGIILRGAGQKWQIVDQEVTDEDLWSIEYFNQEVFFASDSKLFKLSDNHFVEQDIGLSGPATCGHLDKQDGVLWSFGTKFLSFFDGKTWHPIQVPK